MNIGMTLYSLSIDNIASWLINVFNPHKIGKQKIKKIKKHENTIRKQLNLNLKKKNLKILIFQFKK